MSLEISQQAQRRRRIHDSLPTDHPAVLDQILALMDQLPDPSELSINETAGSLSPAATARNRMEAWLTAVAAEADARGTAKMLLAGTTGTMVGAATNSNPAAGSGLVNTGRELRCLPAVAAAFREGRISSWHVTALAEAAPRIDGFQQIEDSLAELASQVEPKELRRILDVLICQSIPEGADIDHNKRRTRRGLKLGERQDGMWKLSGLLDGITGQKLHDALQPLMAHTGPTDNRTATERRADALDDLVSMARANTRPMGVSGLTVLIDVENLPEGIKAALEDGTVLGPDTFDWVSCSVALAAVFGQKTPKGFRPLALARSKRRATHDQWLALVARDRGCIRCGKPPRYTEAHHIIHWRDGGLTDLSNLCLLCSRCHHDLHMGDFDVLMGADGIPTLISGRGPPKSRTG